jgi:hypothetical protein
MQGPPTNDVCMFCFKGKIGHNMEFYVDNIIMKS